MSEAENYWGVTQVCVGMCGCGNGGDVKGGCEYMYLGEFISQWGLNRIMFSQARFRLLYEYPRINKRNLKKINFECVGIY